MLRPHTLGLMIMCLTMTIPAASSHAQETESPNATRMTEYNLSETHLAIQGYDPVAYFPEGGGEPRKGSSHITTTYRGVVYHFVNEQHKAMFLAGPWKYEPRFGGWCAYAMGATGEKVEVDPKAFRIDEGHLNLFYRSFFNDTRKAWAKNIKTLAPKADANWRKLTGEREPVADFTLKAAGREDRFTLSQAKTPYIALHFLLKTECPICLRHTRTYHERQGELDNVTQVFIKPDSEKDILKWLGDSADEIVIYRDPEAALATKLDIPDGYQFQGETVHYPALILLDRGGREVFRYVGKSNRDRYDFDKLKALVEQLDKPA